MPAWLHLLFLFGLVGLLCFLIFFLREDSRRKERRKVFDRLSRLGSAFHLEFTSETIWNEMVVGLDARKRMLLFITATGQISLIRLDEMRGCRLEKIRDTMGRNRYIFLFHYRDKLKPPEKMIIPSNNQDQDELETRLQDWIIMISKLILASGKVDKRA